MVLYAYHFEILVFDDKNLRRIRQTWSVDSWRKQVMEPQLTTTRQPSSNIQRIMREDAPRWLFILSVIDFYGIR